MKIHIGAILMAATALLQACATPSVHPLYTTETLVFEPALVGTWKADDATPTYTVTKAADNLYQLVVRTNDKENRSWELEMRLVKLGDHLFADFELPRGVREELDERHGPLAISTHLIALIRMQGAEVGVSHLEPEWIRKMEREAGATPDHTSRMDNQYLITASTAALQEFCRARAGSDAFKPIARLKRHE
jgi:hypothetical protein